MTYRLSEQELESLIQRKGKTPQAKQKETSKQRLFAKGRLKQGEMNKTEARYEQHLKWRQNAGEILWYRFECIKLRLADNTFLTVDFAVMLADGTLELHDVKGAKAIIEEDAKVKMKVAAEAFPFVFRYVFPKPKGEGWIIEEV